MLRERERNQEYLAGDLERPGKNRTWAVTVPLREKRSGTFLGQAGQGGGWLGPGTIRRSPAWPGESTPQRAPRVSPSCRLTHTPVKAGQSQATFLSPISGNRWESPGTTGQLEVGPALHHLTSASPRRCSLWSPDGASMHVSRNRWRESRSQAPKVSCDVGGKLAAQHRNCQLRSCRPHRPLKARG